MSFRDRKQDREFRLDLLRTQLKHERDIVLYGVGMAVGASFLVFALTLGLTVVLTEKDDSSPMGPYDNCLPNCGWGASDCF